MESARVPVVVAVPPRLRTLVAAVSAVGALCGAAAVVRGVYAPRPELWALAGVIAVFGLSRVVVRLRLRLGSGGVFLDWSEAALVVFVVHLDAPWLVIGAAVGMVLAYAWSRIELIKMVFNVATAVIGLTCATGVLAALGETRPSPSTFHGALAMVIAAAVFLSVCDLATAAAVALSQNVSLVSVYTDGYGMKALVFAGNVSVAFGVLAVAEVDVRLLAAIPPLLWLFHQSYAGRLRARAERRAWQALAAATHGFNQLDFAAVVDTAVGGAAQLFGADVVEIELTGRPADAALTRGDDAGNVWRGPASVARPEPTVIETRLAGGADGAIGTLRLCYRSTDVRLTEREGLALSTFADSLAAALRNAEVHEQLLSLAERKAHEASHDPLTGLANRSSLLERGAALLAPVARSGTTAPQAVALLLLDFDHFKEVNDTLGHGAGDELLGVVARRLEDRRRPEEVLARLGGDEFAMLIPVTGDTGSTTSFAKRRASDLLTAVAEPIELGQLWLTVETSVGVAVTAVGDADIAELLRRADVAMYQAKRTAQQVVSYDAGKDAGSIDRLALVSELQAALEDGDQILLNLQPSIDLTTGAPLGAEALVRWQHPRRGMLRPGEFIPYIERTDLIGPLTTRVLDLALEACRSWEEGGLELPVAVNLSARSLLDRDLPRRVGSMLKQHGMSPDRLVLEITETVMMSELEIIEDVLSALREIGVQLSLDDFGTGYSSLTVLARVKVDEVKIDQEFVGAMHSSPEAAAIVRTTIELARSLGLRVIAEGVENAEQRAVLAQLGCTGAQGYHLYPPMSPRKARAAMFLAAQAAAERSTATVIPIGPKRAPWLGRRRTADEDG